RTEVLYVSPLKALSNDIQKNLEVPLGEILQLAGQQGMLMPEIRTAVRTGDTLAHERRAMLAHPPHILVTTPESLYILLTAARSLEILRAIEFPGSELGPVTSNEMWDEIYDRIAALSSQHRSTLVFVNTRRLAERMAHHLGERLGKDAVAAHHGSLSRKLRLAAERKLKAG